MKILVLLPLIHWMVLKKRVNMNLFHRFFRRLKTKPKDWYYRIIQLNILNSHRFRTKEFKDIDWKNSIVLIGQLYVWCWVNDDHTIVSKFG